MFFSVQKKKIRVLSIRRSGINRRWERRTEKDAAAAHEPGERKQAQIFRRGALSEREEKRKYRTIEEVLCGQAKLFLDRGSWRELSEGNLDDEETRHSQPSPWRSVCLSLHSQGKESNTFPPLPINTSRTA